MLSETEINKIREEAEKKYDEFFGTGYWEEQYKKHIVEFTKQFAQEKLNDERERAKELIETIKGVLDSWNKRNALEIEEKKYNKEHDFYYWSPVASMVDSEPIHNLKQALDTYNKTI